MAGQINRWSSRITQPKSQGASQAQLFATGFSEADLDKAQIGIASIWYEGNNCNMHLLGLADAVKEGVEAAGVKGMRFNTVGVSDGMSMGTEGMSFSLQSRDLIADSIETVTPRGQWYDGLVTIPGCDKNMPGCLMAMGRINRPSIMVYGGTIRGGRMSNGQVVDIVNAFQSYGQYLAGSIDEGERAEIVRNACPGPGACGGMYTANTMATAIEAMGMSLPYSSSTPATDPAKPEECRRAGAVVRALMEKDIKPRDIMTRTAFENAMVMVMVLGGSTNAVLHLIAMARAVDVDLTIDDFQSVSDRIPYIADLKAERQVRDGGSARGRRGAGGDEVPPLRGPHRRRLPDLHRPDHRREPGGRGAARRRPEHRVSPRLAHQGQRTHPHPAGQSRPGRRGGEDYRQGGTGASKVPPTSSMRRRTCCAPWRRGRSPRAT